MSERLRGMLGRRGLILLFAVLLSLPLAIGAYAASGHGGSKKPTSTVKAAETDDQTGHGETETDTSGTDTLARFHGDGTTSCDLPDGADALSGNWSHGDYVSAWARWANQQKQQGLSTESIGSQVKAAAQSPCGKPLTATQSHGQSGELHGKSAEAHTHRAEHQP